MQYCEHCDAEVPVRSHFCGNCGLLLGDGAKEVSDITRPSQPDLPVQGTPSLFKNPFHSPIDYAQPEPINEGGTIQHDWSQLEVSNEQPRQQFEQPQERNTDENRAVFPDAMLPFAPLGYGQLSAANAPAIQGTPQIGGVPSVPGTPSAGVPPASPGAPPVEGGLASHAAPSMPHSAPSVPQHTWTWEQPQHHVEHAQPTPAHGHTQVHHQPEHTIPTSPLKHDAAHEQHPQHHYPQHPVKVQHTHRFRLPHGPKAGAATTKLAAGAATKWAIVALTAVVVLAASGVIFVLANAPGLSLSGASSITAGGTLHIHGKGFVPGGSVALTLDNGLPVTTAGPHTQSVASIGAGSGVADASQLFTTIGQAQKLTPASSAVTVGVTGSFDADVNVLPGWSPGKHILHATEGLGSRSATLTFTILAIPAHLTVTPSNLDFSSVPVGGKVVKSVLIGNTGGSQLTWNATTHGSPWLKLTNALGAVEPNGAQDPLYVTVDATHLKVGDYTASITINSKSGGGGDAQIAVQAHISPLGKANQAQVNVNPATLDYGKLSAGQQVFDNITIGNQGTAALKWQADTGGATWLMLSAASGKVAAGGLPQTVQVIADTSNSGLKPGLNKATITIKSNGGMATIAVTLTLNSTPTPGGSPTPTVTATPLPPILSGGPSGFSVPGDPNCTYNSASGWSCKATLSSFSSAQSNLSWTATSSGISGVSFSPPSGVLTPGQQNVPVVISIPNTVCPTTATFTFHGPANAVPMAWSCAAPTLNVSPTTLTANTDCQFNNGWTCSVSLSPGASVEGQLNWTASSSGISGITINPANGVLTAGQSPTPISITVPNTPCPAAATITFSGQGSNSVPVSWGCNPPQINVSPTTLGPTTSGCTPNSDGTYNCTVAVSETPAGTLNWTATANNGGTINPSTGQLTPGQSSQTVTLMSIPCQTGSYTFSGTGSNTVQVTWSCTLPQINVSPTTLDPTSTGCTQNSDGTFNCPVSVSETSAGTLNWTATASNGGSVNPPNGQLSPGQSSQTVMLMSIPCQGDSFMFSGQGSNTATVTWSCTPPKITVVPNSISPTTSGCSQNSDGTYTCMVTVGETSPGNLNWFAPTGIGGTNVTFTPSSGQLSVNQQQQTVTIASIPCGSYTFTFVDQNNNMAAATWSCSPPMGTASLGSCSYTAGSGWSCPITITANSSNQTAWSWSASSSGSNITVTPSNGSLTPGQSATATATIPDMLCPASATITITGPANNIPLNWSCSAPGLSITVNTPTCPGDSTNGWNCTITLSLTSGSQGDLNWSGYAPSNLPGATLSPSSGTLAAGQSTQITIFIPGNDCTNGTFTFTGSDNSTATVTWNCPQSG